MTGATRARTRGQPRAAALLLCAAAGCGAAAGPGAGWSAPTEIGRGAQARELALRMDASGDAVAVWLSGPAGVEAMRFDARTTAWGPPSRLEANAADDASDLALDGDSQGNAVVVWRQLSAGAESVWSSWLDAGARTWHAAALVEIDDTGDAGEPCVAAAPGGAVAVWHQFDGLRESLWSNRLEGTPLDWTRRALLETTDSADAREPDVAVDPAGNAVAVWTQTDDDGAAFVWAARRAPGPNAWSAPVALSTGGTYDPARTPTPRVALDAPGDGVAVWSLTAGGVSTIWAARYDAATASWAEADLLAADDRGPAVAPALALDGRGDAFVAWQLRGEASSEIWARRLVKRDGAWAPPARLDVEQGRAGQARAPAVAAAGDGHAIVVWPQRDGVRASRFDARDGAWGAPTPLDAGGASPGGARVALDPAGNAVAVWARARGDGYELMAARQAR